MNVDDLDLPPGLIKMNDQHKSVGAGFTNKANLNKELYISNWLENNSANQRDNNAQNENERNENKPCITSDILSQYTFSTHSSKKSELTAPIKEQLYPAGYPVQSSSNSNRSRRFSKEQIHSKTDLPSGLNIVKKEGSHGCSSSKQISSPNVTCESKTNPKDLKFETEWKLGLERERDSDSSGSFHNAQMQRQMKQAVKMCTCEKCEQQIPDGLEYPEQESFTKKHTEQKRPPPLMRSDESLITSIMTAPVSKVHRGSLVENKLRILTHGLTVPQPQNEVHKTYLIPAVQEKLKYFGYERSRPVQSYGWPAIMRGNNAVIIHKHKTGKTSTYIPALCSFLMDQEGRYDRMPDTARSPLLLVLANNSTVAEDVYLKFLAMLQGNILQKSTWLLLLPLEKKDVLQLFKRKSGPTDKCKKNSKTKIHHTAELEILITTPDTLIMLLNDRIIDLKRLRHFVVENLDVILEKLPNPFQLLLGAVDSMLSHRNSYDGVQFVCTGEKWTKKLEAFVGKLDSFPLIIIGSHLQAALYGRANFEIQCVEEKAKPDKLSDLLKSVSYQVYKTIVVCDLNEANIVQSHFATKGINCVTATDDMIGSQVVDLLISWLTTPNGHHIDRALRQYMNVSSATFLVNYSLPSTWSLFSQRFSTLIGSYNCPFTSTAGQSKFYCQVVTYVDEKSVGSFLRLSSFFTTNGVGIPDVLQRYCKEERMKKEHERINSKTSICKVLYTFGTCKIADCEKRHILSSALESASRLPANGRVTFKVINMKEINHYILQVLEYTDIEGNTQKVFDHATTVTELIKENTAFEISSEAIQGKMYICTGEKEFYRCVIIRVIKWVFIGNTKTDDPLEVEIFGLDNGVETVVNVSQLCTIPRVLQQIPSNLVEVYVAKIIPPFKDSLWTKNANRMLSMKLKSLNKSAVCVGNILLRLNDTIWVDDLHMRETDGPFPNCLSVTQFLRDKHLYDCSTESLNNLYTLCKNSGIELPEYKVLVKEVAPRPKLCQAEPAWAVLTSDELNPVYFSVARASDCIFVRHAKFDSLLKKLEEDIAASPLVRRKLNRRDIVEGVYYCVTDVVSGNWCRVFLQEVKEDVAKCFYVDYGDCADRSIEDLRLLPNALLTRLPFQAIECSLYGIKPSSTVALVDSLYEQSFEPNTDYFKTLYTMLMASEKTDGRKKYKIILLDCYSGESSSINRNLLKMNLAETLPEESLEKIELPKCEAIPDPTKSQDVVNQVEDVFSKHKREYDMEFSHIPESERINFDDFDYMYFFEDQNVQQAKHSTTEAYIPMKAPPKSDNNLVPKIKWYQDDAHVFIEFVFNENNDYKINIMRNRYLSFESVYRRNNYSINLILYCGISKNFVHQSKTHFIEVTLTKDKELEWPRLTKSEEKMRNISYKVDRIAIDSDTEEDETADYIRLKDIDDKYFDHAVVTWKENNIHLEEYYSDYDDSDDDDDDFHED